MKRTRIMTFGITALFVAALAAFPGGSTQETIDYEALAKSRAEGMQNSQVMELASWMTDVHGPRLSGSPNIQKAGEWAVATMKQWGLQNVALEPWTDQSQFPRGRSNDKFYLAAVSPQAFPMTAMVHRVDPGHQRPDPRGQEGTPHEEAG